MKNWLVAPIVGASLVVGALGMSAFAGPNNPAEKRAETFKQLELFADILAKVESEYVTEVDETAAIEASIDGMLASLDPHSSYLNPDEFKDM
jgi:carboxyl-terminal processing protease